MHGTESKTDAILKIAVCLAMIGSIVGCIGGSGTHTDNHPAAQGLRAPSNDQIAKSLMYGNELDARHSGGSR